MSDDLVERVARDIADALGDKFDYAFSGKSDWITHRGETPAGFRDVNQPYKTDYIDAAIAAIAIIEADRAELVADVFAYLIAKAQEPVEIYTGSFAKPLHADERTAWLEKMQKEYNEGNA